MMSRTARICMSLIGIMMCFFSLQNYNKVSVLAATKEPGKMTVTSAIIQSTKTAEQAVTFTRELSREELDELEKSFDFHVVRMARKGKAALIVPSSEGKFIEFLKNDLVSGSYNVQKYETDAQTIEWGTLYVGATLAHANVPAISGSRMVVAVIDTGVQLDHPDLVNVIKSGGYDYYNDDSDPTDDNGHGTHIAGTIAANNNTIDIVGIAYGAKILPFKVCNAAGSCDSLAIADAIDDATNQNVDVINISLGGDPNELVQSAINRATAAGIIVVASSGNNGGTSCLYPAAYSNVVCVGAIDSSEARPSFSNYGTELDVTAPGVGIKSLGLAGGTATMSGTSMAAAHYSGVAAVVRGIQEDICTANPAASMCSDIRGYTQFFINNILVRDLGDYGFDSQFGTGAVDLGRLFIKTTIAYSNLPATVNQGTAYLQTVNITNNNSFDLSLKSCKVRGDNLYFTQTQPFWTTGWLVAPGAAFRVSSTSLFESRYTMATPYTIPAGATRRFDYSVIPSQENRMGDTLAYLFTCYFDNAATVPVESHVLNPVVNTTLVQQPDPLDNVYYRFSRLQENQIVSPSDRYNTWDTLTFFNYDATKMRLIGIYTLDYDTNFLSGATYVKTGTTTYNVKTSYLLASGHRFAYVATLENISTGRYAYKFFNFSTN